MEYLHEHRRGDGLRRAICGVEGFSQGGREHRHQVTVGAVGGGRERRESIPQLGNLFTTKKRKEGSKYKFTHLKTNGTTAAKNK